MLGVRCQTNYLSIQVLTKHNYSKSEIDGKLKGNLRSFKYQAPDQRNRTKSPSCSKNV